MQYAIFKEWGKWFCDIQPGLMHIVAMHFIEWLNFCQEVVTKDQTLFEILITYFLMAEA